MSAASDSVAADHPEPPAIPAPPRVSSGRGSAAERQAAAAEARRAFCARLQTARERRGLTLSAIAGATKVAESLFAELEQGDLSHWPAGIYRRSFFREYSGLIGLPVDSTTREFVRLFPDEPGQGASRGSHAPGPLRLTLANRTWLRVPGAGLRAAIVDGAIVFGLAALLSVTTGFGFWSTLALVAVLYHLIATATLGTSPGSWWFGQGSARAQTTLKGLGLFVLLVACSQPAAAQDGDFRPEIGQPGKDVVWVPSPERMVETMLDLAQVTPRDFVIDLGSGDGRNVIAAARRGARARGVEYNPDMVALSRRAAAEAGVADRVQFVEGDMFAADISDADVLALFLLPSNLLRLREKFLDLRPGSRIVLNTFSIQNWSADETVELDGDCSDWCTAYLYVVPAKVAGTWQAEGQALELTQTFQQVTGTLRAGGIATPVEGALRGSAFTFTVGDRRFSGQVDGRRIRGTMHQGTTETPWEWGRE